VSGEPQLNTLAQQVFGEGVMRTLECRRGSRRIVCSGFIILRELIPLLTDLDLQFRLIEDEGQKQKLPTFLYGIFTLHTLLA
tara:strand:- start:1063 stop:1308 length:246 start_codon:yes stop_codon:yes gene_type:complete